MTIPPELKSTAELELLFQEHGFEQKLMNCQKLSFREPQSAYHETFCCKRELVRYIDSGSSEIAVIVYQTDSNGDASKNQRVIRTLHLNGRTYARRL